MPVGQGAREDHDLGTRSGREWLPVDRSSSSSSIDGLAHVSSYMRPTVASLQRDCRSGSDAREDIDATVRPSQHAKPRSRKSTLSRFERLPEDIMLHILSFLDYVGVIRVRRASRCLSHTTRHRSLWVMLIQNHDLSPLVQRRLDIQTSAELESVLARKAKADHAWMDNNAIHVVSHPSELTHNMTPTRCPADYMIAPGGRWAFLREDTRIVYADLELPARGWKTLVEGESVVSALASYDVTKESAYFSLRIATCGGRKKSTDGKEGEGETCFSVHSVSVVFDEAGNINGLEAVLLSSFALDGGYKVDALSVYQERMAVAFRGINFHRIIDWRTANGCRNSFPEIQICGLPLRAVGVLLLPNNFYLTYTHTGPASASIYDLSPLSPNSNDQPCDVQPVYTVGGCELIRQSIFIPFIQHRNFTTVLVQTEVGILRLALPLESNGKPELFRLFSTLADRTVVASAKFMTIDCDSDRVERSTFYHVFPHPECEGLTTAHTARFRFPERSVLCLHRFYLDHLSNRCMAVHIDGDVRIIDLVL